MGKKASNPEPPRCINKPKPPPQPPKKGNQQMVQSRHDPPPRKKTDKTGLTDKEQEIMDALVLAWNGFINLPNNRDISEIRINIHRLQDILALRVVKRAFPEGWT